MSVALALGVAALIAVLWLIYVWQPSLQFQPEVAPGPGDRPRVCIIVSMFNEEKNVDEVLESLRAQTYDAIEVIAVDDRSSDGTSARLAEWQRRWPELRVVRLDHHPATWCGKSWPMYHGARVATGEWLLFLDADLRLHPTSVAETVNACRERDWDELSVLGRVRFGTFFERVLQSQLMSLYLMLAAETPHATACGHYMLVRRSVYEATGGWAMVYDEMQDDVALPRLLSEHGYVPRMRVWLDSHTVEPYRDLPEVWRATRRVIAGAAGFQPRHSALSAAFGLLVNLLPWLILLVALREHWYRDLPGRLSTGFVAAIIGCMLLGYARQLRLIGLSPWMCLTRPLADGLVCGVQIDAALHAAFGRLEWKGIAFSRQRGFSEDPSAVDEFAGFCGAAHDKGWTNAWVRRLAHESECLRLFFNARRHGTLSAWWLARVQPVVTWRYALRLAVRHGRRVHQAASVGRLWMAAFLTYGCVLAQLALWVPAWLRWAASRRGAATLVTELSPEQQRTLRAEAFRRFEQQHRPWFQATPWERKPWQVEAEVVPASGATH